MPNDEQVREAVEAVEFYDAVCRGIEHPRKSGNLNADLEVSRNAVLNRVTTLTTALAAKDAALEAEKQRRAKDNARSAVMRSRLERLLMLLEERPIEGAEEWPIKVVRHFLYDE